MGAVIAASPALEPRWPSTVRSHVSTRAAGHHCREFPQVDRSAQCSSSKLAGTENCALALLAVWPSA